MAGSGSRRLSGHDRVELWRRWRAGETLTQIGEALCITPASVFSMVRRSGGFSPPQRQRSSRSLTFSDREEISRGLAAGDSLRSIAARLGRPASTVSREVSRNGGRSRYRAEDSDRATWSRARRPKECLLKRRPRLRSLVAKRLSEDWSPQQIAEWLRREFHDDAEMQVSHETIYKSLFVQARGVLKQELLRHLRSGRLMRRSKHATTKGQGRGAIKDAISIRERSASAEDRAVPGHWEDDLLSGSGNTHIATLVERRSRFTILVKVASKDTQTVVKALKRRVRTLSSQLRRSLTWDRGMEMAAHKDFTVATDVQVYFCDPQSPWQRGTNENTNLLLRQYFPKGTDLSVHSQSQLDRVARRLNARPRKTLDYHTPAFMIEQTVATTG
jgi:IS30 family transposase